MRFAIEVFHVVLGLVAAIVIAALSAWAVARARHEIWLIDYVAIAFIIGMGFQPMRAAWLADRAAKDDGKHGVKVAASRTGKVDDDA